MTDTSGMPLPPLTAHSIPVDQGPLAQRSSAPGIPPPAPTNTSCSAIPLALSRAQLKPESLRTPPREHHDLTSIISFAPAAIKTATTPS